MPRKTAKLVPSKRARGPEVPDQERRKRVKAAERVMNIITNAGVHTSLTREMPVERDKLAEWVEAYKLMLVGDSVQVGFEHRTLQKAVAAWARWETWLHAKAPEANPISGGCPAVSWIYGPGGKR